MQNHGKRGGRRGTADAASEAAPNVRTPEVHEPFDGWMSFSHSGPLCLYRLTAEQIDIRDVTRGLGHINRWLGQTETPVSVLWHSLLVMRLCAAETRPTQLEALWHDAAETYVGDWIRPLDGNLGGKLIGLRTAIQQSCYAAVGLQESGPERSQAVQVADDLMLRAELEAQWGGNRTVTWHATLTSDEHEVVHEAMKGIGRSPRTEFGVTRLQDMFIDATAELAPEGAPIRRSVAKALQGRRGGTENGNTRGPATEQTEVMTGKGRRQRAAAEPDRTATEKQARARPNQRPLRSRLAASAIPVGSQTHHREL